MFKFICGNKKTIIPRKIPETEKSITLFSYAYHIMLGPKDMLIENNITILMSIEYISEASCYHASVLFHLHKYEERSSSSFFHFPHNAHNLKMKGHQTDLTRWLSPKASPVYK